MTKHDLKELAAMGAELGAAKAENERLRGLLREFCERVERGEVRSKSTYAKFRAALSPQPEPTDTYTAVDMDTAAAQGFRDGQAAVEQAPAQDERELCPSCHGSVSSGGRMHCNAAGDSEYEAFRCESCDGFGTHLTRPAQTEQQPVAWQLKLPDGRVTLEKAFPSWAEGGDGYEIQPLYATPIAQTALSAVTAERDAANSRLHEVAVACAEAEQERDQLRAEVEASDWIPLTKATPPDGVPVLRWPGWAAEFSIDEWCNDYGCFLMSIEGGERATHWKPLRAPKAAMAAKEA